MTRHARMMIRRARMIIRNCNDGCINIQKTDYLV
jgi:hypothetical protein